MFQEVLRDPEICAELVERLLHISVGHIEYPELEKTIAPYYTTKGVRLDVYLKDSDKIIDVELQSYPQEALGKRTRYYQSMIDMDSLMKGQLHPLHMQAGPFQGREQKALRASVLHIHEYMRGEPCGEFE